MSSRARFAIALALAGTCLSLFGIACGGGGAPPTPVKSGKQASDKSADSETGDDGAGADGEPAPRAARCTDGTSFECGAGICPKGFYCDEKALGGPACGWLPECAASASCSCVKQVLGDCSCAEKAGGVSVSCQGL